MRCELRDCLRRIQFEGDNSQCGRNCLCYCDVRSIAKMQENGKKYCLHNENREKIAVFHVDGGMLDSNEIIKCDYLMIVENKVAVFVELKGTNLAHAFKQILNSVEELEDDLLEYALCARIVTSSRTNVPNYKTDPNYIRIMRKFVKRVKVKENVIEDYVSELSL